MKKLFLSTLAFLVVFATQSFATKPIPSYDVPLYNAANFQEKPGPGGKAEPKEKRQLNVQTTVAPGGPRVVTQVYIYSLDYKTILGPFSLFDSDKITVDIDARPWGVVTITQDPSRVSVSVWIDKYDNGDDTKSGYLENPDENIFNQPSLFTNGENLTAVLPEFRNEQTI